MRTPFMFRAGGRGAGYAEAEMASGGSVVVPADVTTVKLRIQAKGATGANNQAGTGGGGGGGGAYAVMVEIPVTAGETLSFSAQTVTYDFSMARIDGSNICGAQEGQRSFTFAGGYAGNQYYKTGRCSGLSWTTQTAGSDGTDGTISGTHIGGNGGQSGSGAAGGNGGTTGVAATVGASYGGGGGGAADTGAGAAGGAARLYYTWND